MESNSSITRSAFKVYLGNAFTLIARVASQVVIAAIFGTGSAMDCFFAALVIPLYIEAVFVNSLSLFMIPAFVHEETTGTKDDAWAMAGTMFWLIAVTLTLLAAVAAAVSHGIISVSAPGLGPAKAELATAMMAIMLFTIPLNGLGELTRGILNARNSFFRPAIAPAFGTLANVVIVIALYGTIGPMALAWGYLGSSFVRSCITVIPVLKNGWTHRLRLNDSRVIGLLRLAFPLILFSLLTQSTYVVERFFASGLPEGQLSYLGYAERLSGNIMLALGAGIAISIFPAMARTYAKSGESALADKAQYGIRLALALALPTLAVVTVIALPTIKVFFERGSFENSATIGVGIILPIVMVGHAFTHLLGNVVARTYFVMRNTHTVPFVAFLMSIAYIGLAYFMVHRWGYVGLAWAGTVKASFVAIILASWLAYRSRFFRIPHLLNAALAYSIAALVAGGAAWIACRITSDLGAMVQVACSLIISGVCYLALLYRLDREIAVSILELAGIPDTVSRLRIFLVGKRRTSAQDTEQ